jgi:hypothetical protein
MTRATRRPKHDLPHIGIPRYDLMYHGPPSRARSLTVSPSCLERVTAPLYLRGESSGTCGSISGPDSVLAFFGVAFTLAISSPPRAATRGSGGRGALPRMAPSRQGLPTAGAATGADGEHVDHVLCISASEDHPPLADT